VSARRVVRACLVVVLLVCGAGPGRSTAAGAGQAPPSTAVYQPELAVPELLAPFLEDVEPGHDAFTSERDASEIAAVLARWGGSLRVDGAAADRMLAGLLAPDFRGARLTSPAAGAGGAAFVVRRSEDLPQTLALNRRAFRGEIRRLVGDLRSIAVAEFLVTAIAPEPGADTVRTDVRYDIAGPGIDAWRAGHVGTWRMRWRRAGAGWQIVEWTAAAHTSSLAPDPVFTEITGTALGGIESFQRQLGTSLDDWMATLDSVLTRDSNGHHGVSVGDADGDGLDDLYVAQPSGLPNRLYRNKGDGTFEDVTDAAGVGVLDDTAMSLFVDVDNDGDQDLVLATGTQPLLFLNDGTGRFTAVPDAFRFARPLQGSLTSIAMADYDRDGHLDVYLCVYSYFYGAGEEKAGTPMPYHDARNGPPGVLFRNDGTGRFVDVTAQAGLEAGNDRYHFAASWADYDEDGWPDLLVVNDFGTNNLYRNKGDGTFEDVAAAAGVLDHAAGMSAAFVDYDNDGLLDIYTGNMWSDAGQRVTASPGFMPDAPPEVRALYQRHARGNSLFRNRGDGTFEDVTIPARAAMGRWAWSSDGLDFDADGWEDLYVANGMISRQGDEGDLDGFFWRQVVARSPLSFVKGTPYDDAWRAINQLLVHGSIAMRQRNVFLRNDGEGGFDDVSATVGLDLDQDGRSFVIMDLDRDGDPDLVVMAARQTPQLRVFRNDFTARGASLAIRLAGTDGNRDAIGATVRVETERLRRTKAVHAGSGFLSQHSRELLFGLGASERIVRLSVRWPSGRTQEFTDLAPNERLRLVEGGELERQPFERVSAAPAVPAEAAGPPSGPAPAETWMYEPFQAPDFVLSDRRGEMRSLAALRGRPAVLLLWSPQVDASRAVVEALAREHDALTRAGLGVLAIAVDASLDASRVVASTAIPVVSASREVALGYALLHRHLFMNRQALRLPTTLLIDPSGGVVRVYRGAVDAARLIADAASIEASPAERLARAVPFAGTFYSPLPPRNYLPYGRSLLDEGLEAAAVVAFERAAAAVPSAPTLYRLGTLLLKTGETSKARAAYERALVLEPELAEANNDLGTLLAQDGDLDAAIARFRLALAATPEYPDALNNLGYALLLTGRDAEARALYEQALALQPDFPEALNNLGLLLGRSGDLDGAERYFRAALERQPRYGEAANNIALVLVSRGDATAAIALLEGFLERAPEFESAYVTLAKILFTTGRDQDGFRVLDRLLQRNPTHPVGLELLRVMKP
jgi:Flp pilus assembly protein TadD/peroxiredoxin